MHEKLQIQFKNLANDILDEKTKKFTDQNKTNLSDILNPLKERIEKFEEKVEKSSKESVQWNTALSEQIKSFKDLGKKLLSLSRTFLHWPDAGSPLKKYVTSIA